MIRGWYIGSSGMNAQQNRLDAISNNLANVDTTGYKRTVAVSKNFSELLIRRMNDDGVKEVAFGSVDTGPIVGKLGLGVETNEIFTIFEQGSFKQTDGISDMALQGEGFFAVETPYGERYTRNGNFMVGVEGFLETKEGYPVLGENGRILVGNRKFNVNVNGEVTFSDDTEEMIDRLKLVRFDNERHLEKMGSGLYSTNDIAGEAKVAEGGNRPQIFQGYVETSNVNVINEMVQMIEVNRAYEMNQKTIQSEDAMMTNLWTKVATLR